MNNSRPLRWLAASLLLAGCQVLPERPPLPAVHDFGPPPSRHGGPPSPWMTVTVQAPEWLHDPMIRYRLLYAQPTQVRFYQLDRWVAPPPDLLAGRLAADRGTAGYELRIELQSFEQTFAQPDRSTVLLRWHAEAINPVNGFLAAERNFDLAQPTRSADAAGAVDGFSRVVDRAVSEVRDWMGALPAPERIAGPADRPEQRGSIETLTPKPDR